MTTTAVPKNWLYFFTFHKMENAKQNTETSERKGLLYVILS